MRVCFTSSLFSMILFAAGLWNVVACGQEPGSPAGPRGPRAPGGVTSVAQEAGKLIAFEVTIIERAGEPLPGQKGKPPTPAQIMELEKDTKNATVQRLQLVVLENVESRLQLGETAPMVTSRVVRSRDAGGNFGGGGGFPGSESVTYTEIGTLLSVTARVEADSKVVAAIHVARTNLIPPKAGEKVEGQEPAAPGYARKQTSTISTTARIATGESVVLAAQQNQTAGSPSETWVLVTAKVQ